MEREMFTIVIQVTELRGEWDMLEHMLLRTDYGPYLKVLSRDQKIYYEGPDLEHFISYLVMHRIRFEVLEYVWNEHPADERPN
jgi:hypothetical protein